MALEKQLTELGLTKTQAKIYLSILKQKEASVLEVAKDTGIQRPTIYENADYLDKLNLVSWAVTNGRKLLVAEAPENLESLLEEKRALASSILGDLNKLYNTDKLQLVVKFYSGEEGAKQLSEVITSAKNTTMYSIGGYKQSVTGNMTEKYLRNLWRRRSELNIKALALLNHSDRDVIKDNPDFSKEGNFKFNREVRFLPQEVRYDILHTILGNKVLMWLPKEEGHFFLFDSKSYAESLKSTFKFLWKLSKPLNSLE